MKKYKGTITGGAAPIENQEVVNDNVTVNKENEENKIMKNVNTEKEDTLMLTGGVSYCHYSDQAENNDIENNTCQEESEGNTDFYIEDEPEQQGYAGDSLEAAAEYKRKVEEEAKKKAEQQAQQAKQKSAIQTNQQWILPVPKGHKVLSYYGMRMHPIYHVMKLHDGIDINALPNTPVYAVADGTVVVAGWVNGYGNYIEIDHGNGIHSFYAHLNQIKVSQKSKVKQVQVIGLSGNTGIGTGPHLHFGVHKFGKGDNPINYLPNF